MNKLLPIIRFCLLCFFSVFIFDLFANFKPNQHGAYILPSGLGALWVPFMDIF